LPTLSKAGAPQQLTIPVNTIIQDYSISRDEYKRERKAISGAKGEKV